MEQNYTEETTTGWGARIKNALVGLILGPILIVIAVYLLWTNESRSVKIEAGLRDGKSQVVAVKSDAVDPASESKLVYVTGRVAIAKNPSDEQFQIAEPAIRIIRKVEMYQWDEHSKSSKSDNVWGSQTTRTTYSYDTVWSENAIDSSKFHNQTPERTNPKDWKYSSMSSDAEGVTVGKYEVLPEMLSQLDVRSAIPLAGKTVPGATAYVPPVAKAMPSPMVASGAVSEATGSTADRMVSPEETALPLPTGTSPLVPPSAATQVRSLYLAGDTLSYSKNPNSPEIGDLRISFYKVAPVELSVIGKQIDGKIRKFTAKNGTEIGLVSGGIVSSDAMFQAALDDNVFMTWLLRALGIVLMFAGFRLFLSFLSVLAAFFPLLGDVVGFGTGLVALVATLVLGGSTIAIAWISARPFLAVVVLVLAAAGVYGVFSYKKNQGVPASPSA